MRPSSSSSSSRNFASRSSRAAVARASLRPRTARAERRGRAQRQPAAARLMPKRRAADARARAPPSRLARPAAPRREPSSHLGCFAPQAARPAPPLRVSHLSCLAPQARRLGADNADGNTAEVRSRPAPRHAASSPCLRRRLPAHRPRPAPNTCGILRRRLAAPMPTARAPAGSARLCSASIRVWYTVERRAQR